MLVDEAELDGVEIDDDLSGCEADGVHITSSTFRGALLTGARLARPRLRGVRFVGCDVSGALLEDAVLADVTFERCRMTGFVLSSARLADVRFHECKLDDAILRPVTGSGVHLVDTTLVAADLSGMVLRSSSFERCDLAGADVARSRVKGVRITGCRLEGLRGATGLAGAVIDPTEAVPLGQALLAELGVVVDDGEDERR